LRYGTEIIAPFLWTLPAKTLSHAKHFSKLNPLSHVFNLPLHSASKRQRAQQFSSFRHSRAAKNAYMPLPSFPRRRESKKNGNKIKTFHFLDFKTLKQKEWIPACLAMTLTQYRSRGNDTMRDNNSRDQTTAKHMRHLFVIPAPPASFHRPLPSFPRRRESKF
jgi:hypothetical protein